MIYADNAATTKLDIAAFEAMKPYLLDEYGNASQPYAFSRSPKKALREARGIIAACINAEPDEIYFTSGGTESDNWAIKGVAFAAEDRNHIVTSAFEHHAILRSCESISTMGYRVAYVRPNINGFVQEDQLEPSVTCETALVSVMMSNNEIGTIQPIQQLAAIAHKHGAIFHTDAVQCVGHIPIDVKALDVDMLSASAHKFNGPKGIGFLYIKRGTMIKPLHDGGSQENGYRAGTENIAAIVGMATALKTNCEEMVRNSAHILQLENDLLHALDAAGISYVRNGVGKLIPGNMSLAFPGFDGEALLHRLDLMGIQVSTGSACDSVNTQISHVLQAIQVDEVVARGTIRISIGKNNTTDEMTTIASAITKIINQGGSRR